MEHEVGAWDEYFSADEDAGTESSSLGDVILALESLTERQKFVIECRYGLRPGQEEPLTHRDIAELTGWHHSTVQEVERLALRKLASLLEPRQDYS